jgi:hypothetical protein
VLVDLLAAVVVVVLETATLLLETVVPVALVVAAKVLELRVKVLTELLTPAVAAVVAETHTLTMAALDSTAVQVSLLFDIHVLQ